MKERGQYRFTVKESARGAFWIAAEPAGDTIKSLHDCVLGFDLEPRASHGHALAVAEFLNRNVAAITLVTWERSDTVLVEYGLSCLNATH